MTRSSLYSPGLDGNEHNVEDCDKLDTPSLLLYMDKEMRCLQRVLLRLVPVEGKESIFRFQIGESHRIGMKLDVRRVMKKGPKDEDFRSHSQVVGSSTEQETT